VTPKWTAQETQRFFITRWREMKVPFALNSLAKDASTSETQLDTLFTLSLGVSIPQFVHWTSSLLPLPPLLRPLDLRFFVNLQILAVPL